MSVFLTILRKGRNILYSKCFLFLSRAGVGMNWGWGGDFGEFFVFLSNVFVDSFNGASVWEQGRVEF